MNIRNLRAPMGPVSRRLRFFAMALGLCCGTAIAWPDSAHAQTITTFAGGVFPGDNTTPYSVQNPTAMTRDASGNLYIASGDPTNSQVPINIANSVARGNRIFKITSGGSVSLIAGNGQVPTSAPNNVVATQAPLGLPAGIAVDPSGNVYFSDESQQLVFKVTAATGILTIVAGNGGNTGENIPAATAALSGPTGLAIDGTARLFIGIKNENRVRVVDLSTGNISTFAGSGAPNTGTPMTRNTDVFQPRGLFYDGASQNLYMALPGNNEIRTASTSGQATIAGGGGGDLAGDGGPAISAKLRGPQGVAKDGTDVLIADTGNQRIRRIDNAGNISTVAGSAPNVGGFILPYGFSGDGGAANSALLDGPSDVRGTGSGNFVFADRGNHRIRTVTSGNIATFAGNGSWGFNGEGIARTSAQLAFPARGEFDSAGNLYFVDIGNNRVRRIDATTGVITTVAGTGLAGYNGDNIPATSANLTDPADVTLDSSGNLYIADRNAFRVRRVDAGTGMITTVAGNGTPGAGGDGGPATSAQLFGPTGVLIDSTGALLIADPTFGISRVRKVIIGGNITAFAGGSGCSGPTSGDGQAPTAAGSCLNTPRDMVEVKVTGNGLVAGDILIAEKSVVRRISGNTLSTYAGSGAISGDAVGTFANARFTDIESLALDSLSNVFTVESSSRKVKKLSGGQVSAYAGNGGFNYNGDNQPATNASLFSPFGIFINPADEVLISDTRNHRIRKAVMIPDLVATKTNNTSNTAQTGGTWTWTINVSNSGSAPANFTSAQIILTDNLPSSGLNYTLGAVTNVSGVTNPGNISCAIDGSKNLTCSATGPVTIGAPSGHFSVPITVTSTAPATYTNPRAAGVCGVDPGNVIGELDDSNNSCMDTVTVSNTPLPNMKGFKSNDVGGTVNPRAPWTWTIAAENRGNADATFADGEVIYRDDLPDTNISYSAVTMDADVDFPDYDGVISCSIDANKTLTCVASGGPVTFFGGFGANPGSSFYAFFTATPSADGTFVNPRSGGSCGVDPDNLLTESDESDNSATNTVVAGAANNPPVANDDSGSVNEDDTLIQGPPGVLANDTDAEMNSLTAVLGSPPSHASSFTLGSDGSYDYTPDPNFNGVDSFTYRASDGSSNSNVATVNLTVGAVNDPPSFTKGADQTVNEDAGAQTVSGWATSISQGPGESGQTLTFNVSLSGTTGNLAFSSGPAIDPSTGTLTYQTSPNTNGSTTVSVTLSDNGSNTPPNSNTSGAQTFTITVSAVNDAPTFQIASDPPTVSEDSGAQSVSSFATNFQPGPATATDETGQTLVGYSVAPVSSTGTLTFSSAPAIDNSGNLTYTPTANTSGTATFNATAQDNGSGTAPNVNTSAPVSFTVTVTSVNDAPVLDNSGNMSLTAINEDVAAAGNPGTLVSDIIASAGGDRITDADLGAVEGIAIFAADTANGAWEFSLNNGTNWSALGAPTVGASRLLPSNASARVRFLPNANFNGTIGSGITFKAWDQTSGADGGTADTSVSGGSTAFSSASETASITVNPVNDAPSFTKGPDQTTTAGSGPQTVTNWATAISAGPADESSQTLTFNVGSDNNAIFATQPAISSSGTLTYTPAASGSGSATVTVTLMDDGGTANGGQDTSGAQTFTITVDGAPSPTPSASPSPTPSASPTPTPSASPSPTPSASPSPTPSASPSPTPSASPSPTPSASPSPTPSASPSPTPSASPSPTPSASPSATPSASPSPTPSASPSPTPTATPSASPSATATPTPTPTPSPGASATPTPTPGASATPAQALNISTRLKVDTGDKVMIGGFIIRGNASKPVVLRGLGPSLVHAGIPAANVLNDPVIELHGPNGAFITSNDNWKDSPQRSQIEGGPFEPTDDRESVIVATLPPAAYTVVLRGVSNTSGVGLVEVYDTDVAVDSDLANISTRGFVMLNENVMIGGFTLGGNNLATMMAVRALGPSLSAFGLANVLADPTLELHNANGTIMVSNDDWQSDPVSAAQLTANGLGLPNPKESGIYTSIAPPGQFTAVVAGKNGGIGIALVEIYNLR